MSRQMMVVTVVMVICGIPCSIRGAEEKQLCAEGTWEGTCRGLPGTEDRTLQVRLDPGFIVLMEGDRGIGGTRHWVDEGSGKCKWKNIAGEVREFGIYKWEGGHLIVCFRESGKGRPKEFSFGGGHILLTIDPKQN
jgi:hypothetical protein